jgi:hypothetical protein
VPAGDAVDDHPPVGMQEVKRDRGAPTTPRSWSVDRCDGRAIAVSQRAERVEQPGTERADTDVDRLETGPVEEAQADLDRREAEVVDGAVFEVCSAGADW